MRATRRSVPSCAEPDSACAAGRISRPTSEGSRCPSSSSPVGPIPQCFAQETSLTARLHAADNIMINDIAYLKELQYDAIICDEAHKAKGLNGR